MIGHQYLSLEVDCHSRFIIGISGYFDLEWCEKQSVKPLPLKKEASIEVKSRESLECGIGYDYPIRGTAIFDPMSNRLFIGKRYKKTQFISLGNNVVLGLLKENLVCIQVENLTC